MKGQIMSWSSGYSIFESQLIGAYNLNKLDKELLSVLMSPFANKDVDYGSWSDELSYDQKSSYEIIVETWGLTLPPKPVNIKDDSEEYYEYRMKVYEEMQKVAQYFKW